MPLDRLRLISKGYPGGNGYTNLYFLAVTSTQLTALATLITALKAFQPINVAYQFPSSGDTIDETDGSLVGGWSVTTPPADILMTGGQAYSAPTGFEIQWRTTSVVDGHRPMGRSFFVPGAQAVFNQSGGILNTAFTSISAAANLFVTGATGFSLWHRPVYTGKHPNRVLTRAGSIVPVVSGICGPEAVVLTSRRD